MRDVRKNVVDYTGYASVKDFGASGDGSTNDQPAIAAAIASLGGAPGIVYFPAGVYLIRSPISVPSGTILRGVNSKDAILRFDFVAHAIRIYGAETGSWIPLSSSAMVHDSSVTVSGGEGLYRRRFMPSSGRTTIQPGTLPTTGPNILRARS